MRGTIDLMNGVLTPLVTSQSRKNAMSKRVGNSVSPSKNKSKGKANAKVRQVPFAPS